MHSIELLAEREVFEGQLVMSAAGQRQHANDDEDHLQHASILSCYVRQINRSAVRS